MSNIISFFAEQDSLHLRSVHHTGDSAKETREAESFLPSGVNYPFTPSKLKDLGGSRHIFHSHIWFSLQSLELPDMLLYIFLLSLLLYIFSLKKVKGRLGGDSSPEQNDKTVLPFHLSLPQRQWGKNLSCQQTLW